MASVYSHDTTICAKGKSAEPAAPNENCSSSRRICTPTKPLHKQPPCCETRITCKTSLSCRSGLLSGSQPGLPRPGECRRHWPSRNQRRRRRRHAGQPQHPHPGLPAPVQPQQASQGAGLPGAVQKGQRGGCRGTGGARCAGEAVALVGHRLCGQDGWPPVGNHQEVSQLHPLTLLAQWSHGSNSLGAAGCVFSALNQGRGSPELRG